MEINRTQLQLLRELRSAAGEAPAAP